jgi:hypothetical protein
MALAPQYRGYRLRSGLYVTGPPAPEIVAAMDAVRQALIADKGGPEQVTAGERLLIDLAAAAAVKLQRVEAYLGALPCLVDKRHRKVWRVVLDANMLAGHLANVLRDLGVERRPQPVEDLRTYLAKRDAVTAADENGGSCHPASDPSHAGAE